MPRRLISSTKSEIRTMNKEELKYSIQASEGRVILSQNYVGSNALDEGTTNTELAEMFGADMIFFNGYSMNPESNMPGLMVYEFNNGAYEQKYYRLKDMKKITKSPLGIYLECGLGDDPKTSTSATSNLIRPDRTASDENLRKLLDEEADFVILAGNPGTGTSMDTIVDSTKRAKKILGDKVMIWAGKWEDGVNEYVLGDPLRPDSKEVITKLIDAGADVICLPMPGSRTGITVTDIRELVTYIHTYKPGTLAMSFLDGSVEGSDESTIRECSLMSKQTSADIHAIGDAGLSGVASPEGIYQMALTIKGRRLTWFKMASGHR